MSWLTVAIIGVVMGFVSWGLALHHNSQGPEGLTLRALALWVISAVWFLLAITSLYHYGQEMA